MPDDLIPSPSNFGKMLEKIKEIRKNYRKF